MITLPTPEVMQERGWAQKDLDDALATNRIELDEDGVSGVRVISYKGGGDALAVRYPSVEDAETDVSRLLLIGLESAKRDRERGFIA